MEIKTRGGKNFFRTIFPFILFGGKTINIVRLAILFLLVFLFSYSIAYSASSYYVDNSVGSSGDGSISSPWKNLSNINWTTISGASKPCTIYVSGGSSGQTYSEQLAIGASGSSAGNEIIIKRPTSVEWPGHNGIVYVRTTSSDAINFGSRQWVIIDGIDFSASSASGTVINTNNVTIQNCTSTNNGGFSIAGYNSDNVLISANNLGPNNGTTGNDAMQVGPATNWTIEKNLFSADGQRLEHILTVSKLVEQ